MDKISNYIVEKRKIILVIFALLIIGSVWLMTKVNVNSDMTKYLPNNSSTKIGMGIMDDEFPVTSPLNVMFKGLNENEKAGIYDSLSEIASVASVSYEAGSEKYNKDNYTLYTVTMGCSAYSPEAKTLVDTVKTQYSSYDITLSGEAVGKGLGDMLLQIFVFAFAILIVILFVMCDSWIDPFLILAALAVAMLINMGTNAMFDSVSDITKSIASVLQVVLSIDYSIMLLNRYRQEKKANDNKYDAMKKALSKAFTAISSSSVTTIVGMLALVFMSFTIGMDLGLVLAKGVFLSLVSIFTVLPAFIMICDKTMEKTAKRSLHIKMNKLASFSYSARYVISVVFVALLIGSYFLQGGVNITYTMIDNNEVKKIFPPSNSIVVLYENQDEDKIAALADKWGENAAVDSVNAYSTTLGKEMTYTELSDVIGMDETLVGLMCNLYFSEKGDVPEKKIAFGDFIEFLKNDIATNEQFASFFTEDALAQLDTFGGEVRVSDGEFAVYSGMDANAVGQIFSYYFSINGQTEDGKIGMNDFTQFLMTDIASNPQFAPMFTEDVMAQLAAMSEAGNIMEQEMTSAELAEYINMDAATVEMLYNFYAVTNGEVPEDKISLYEFMKFIADDVAESESFKPYFTGNMAEKLTDALAEMDEGLVQLVGNSYSRLILSTSFEDESDETFAFIENMYRELDNALNGEYYIIGNSAMAYEMSGSFPSEMTFITILTAVAIFLVVAISFRSISIPLILVCVIQCAVFITMGTVYLQGSSILYLPLLIVQCLLMGATIDYGILYTSYYKEARRTLNKKDAIAAALNNAIHTIMTSGLILILVTFVLGILLANSNHATSEILLTIAKGALCSSVLVVFIFPSLLSAMDRFVIRKKDRAEET